MRTRLPDTPVPLAELTPARIADALDTAADLIEEVGLHKDNWWEPNPDCPDQWRPGSSCCGAGALLLALGVRDIVDEDDDGFPACVELLSSVCKGLGLRDLGVWSDTAVAEGEPERVTGAFRDLAVQMRQRTGAA